MLRNNKKWIIKFWLLSMLLLVSNIKCEFESINSGTKEESKDDRKRWNSSSDFWLNHKPYYNYVLAKSREAKSNNEPYFTDPNNNDGYETMPSTIQITAIPGGLGTGLPSGPVFPGQYPGITTNDLLNPLTNPFNNQRYPVFVINKSKSDTFGLTNFKWLIPLLLLLGAPLLCGLILIPIVLQSVFFFMTIIRNLGILLPLIPAITGITGNGANPIIPTTG